MTLLNVPREIVADPSHAWYIRDIELWELRESFSCWRTPIFEKSNPYEPNDPRRKNWVEEHHDFSHLGDASREPLYGQDELDQYRRLLVGLLHLPLSEAEQRIDQLVIGCDKALRVLLVALSPNLQRFVFVQYDDWASRNSSSPHPLNLLCSSITRISQTIPKGVQWPCFSRLEVVHVGAASDLRYSHEVFNPGPSEIAPLFLLPDCI